MRVGAWLERFRRPAAVPAAVGGELEAELMPVFAALDEIEGEARALREETEREVTRRLEAAEAEAERALARWRHRAELERARAEAEVRAATTAEAHELELAAQAEAERIRQVGLERIPALVAAVVACIEEQA